MQVMLMRLMSKGEYLIVSKGTKFTGLGKLGLNKKLHAQAKFYMHTAQSKFYVHAFVYVNPLKSSTDSDTCKEDGLKN